VHAQQAGQIVHVVVELRDQQQRPVAEVGP
jgi:hypothetical protein